MPTPKRSQETELAVLSNDMKNLTLQIARLDNDVKGKLSELTSSLGGQFVSKEVYIKEITEIKADLGPVRRYVFAQIGLILLAFGTAVIYLVGWKN
jgi:hypothetical protein